MVRQHVQAARQTLVQHRGVVVLVAVLMLLAGGYTVGTHAATSMTITVWTQVADVYPLPPKVEIFDKTITNEPLVQDTQQQLNGLPLDAYPGDAVALTIYEYRFAFATLGVPTEVYAGTLNSASWTETRFGLPLAVAAAWYADLYGSKLMTVLHQRTGMPLPSGWT